MHRHGNECLGGRGGRPFHLRWRLLAKPRACSRGATLKPPGSSSMQRSPPAVHAHLYCGRWRAPVSGWRTTTALSRSWSRPPALSALHQRRCADASRSSPRLAWFVRPSRKARTSRQIIQITLGLVSTALLSAALISFFALLSTVFGTNSSSPSDVKPYQGGLLLPCLGLIGGLIGYVVFYTIYHDLAQSLETRERAVRVAFARHAGRWLGVWAPTDEAIALLNTVAPGSEADYRRLFTPREARAAAPFVSGQPLIPWKVPLRLRLPPAQVGLVPSADSHRHGRTLIKPMYFLFNRLLAPRLADQLSRTMVRTIQGSDVAGAELVFCSPWPIPLDTPPPGLPDDVAERLETRARSASAELVPISREVMVQAAALGMSTLSGSVAAARAGTEGDGAGALVHTGYFEDPFVLELIIEHIRRGSALGEGEDAAQPITAGDVGAWLDAWTAQVAEHLEKLGFVAGRPR